MSDLAPEAIELPPSGDAAFAALMDTLVAEEAGETAGAGEAPAAAADVAGGVPDASGGTADRAPATATATPAATTAADTADTGRREPTAAATQPDGAGDDAGPDGGDLPAAWTATAEEMMPRIGQLSTALEERTLQAYQQTALDEVRAEHEQYFTALEKHPRLLVGTQVPAIGKEGMETLKDVDDAREWQEAVKSLLVAEVRDRAAKAMDSNAEFLTTVHASIELFQNNPDLVPGTRGFDIELANRFATMLIPYELRVDGKLQGYSIPVQPIIDHLRNQLHAERAAKPAAPAASAAPPAPKPQPDPPQAGIPSKAGAGAESEDFSTLFGTIGLPNLQI